MKFLIPTLARWLHSVALSIWLGGLLAIGALVAPKAFAVLRGSPLLTLPQANTLAGHVVGDSLALFALVTYGCGALLLLSNILLLPYANRPLVIRSLLISALLLVSALLLGLVLTPAMDAARIKGDLPTFDRLHHLYERTSTLVQFPLLLLLAWIGALRDSLPSFPSLPSGAPRRQ